MDKLHLKFNKYVLGVRQTTSKVAVLGELVGFPLPVFGKERALTYWIRINEKARFLMHKMVLEQINIIDNIGVNNNITCRNLYC